MAANKNIRLKNMMKILRVGIIAILIIFLTGPIIYLISGKTTEGKVVEYDPSYGQSLGLGYGNAISTATVIEYSVDGKSYKIKAPENQHIYKDEIVEVIYLSSAVDKAQLNTFRDIFGKPIIYMIISLLIWLSILSIYKGIFINHVVFVDKTKEGQVSKSADLIKVERRAKIWKSILFVVVLAIVYAMFRLTNAYYNGGYSLEAALSLYAAAIVFTLLIIDFIRKE